MGSSSSVRVFDLDDSEDVMLQVFISKVAFQVG